MPTPLPISLSEKLYAILGRINPMIDELNVQSAAIEDLDEVVTGLAGDTGGPDLVLLFENGLV